MLPTSIHPSKIPGRWTVIVEVPPELNPNVFQFISYLSLDVWSGKWIIERIVLLDLSEGPKTVRFESHNIWNVLSKFSMFACLHFSKPHQKPHQNLNTNYHVPYQYPEVEVLSTKDGTSSDH